MAEENAAATRLVIVDMGSHKRKNVRQLKNGEGKLVDRVDEVVAELKGDGTLDPNAQTVVVVVSEKRRNNPFRLF